ncbi:MAG: hypothetical protein ACM3MD_03500 [Betaproteobacteria bacterium]
MHTDEFEISLSRELKVCRNTIQRIKKTLSMMEQKHHKTTEAFIEEYQNGKLLVDSGCKDDYRAWAASYGSLKEWQSLERQYQEQYRLMKISEAKSLPQRHGGTE